MECKTILGNTPPESNSSKDVTNNVPKIKPPVKVYRGQYKASTTYDGNEYRVDTVKYGNNYYVARTDAGTFTSPSKLTDPPTSGTAAKWIKRSRFQREFTDEQQKQLYEALKVGLFIPESVDFNHFCQVMNNEYHRA
jgi:hypothetical protein